MNRVTTENLRSQIEQSDAAFRDKFDNYPTDEIVIVLQRFSEAAMKCPATTILLTIENLGANMAADIITHGISRALGQVLLARWEMEEMEGAKDGEAE